MKLLTQAYPDALNPGIETKKERVKMFNVTKYENNIVVDNYMIHNVDNAIELAKILDKRHNSTKTLACNVYFGSISSGGAGHKIVLAYNNNSKITID